MAAMWLSGCQWSDRVRTDNLEAKRSPEDAEVEIIGCLEVKTDSKTGVLELRSCSNVASGTDSGLPWADGADP